MTIDEQEVSLHAYDSLGELMMDIYTLQPPFWISCEGGTVKQKITAENKMGIIGGITLAIRFAELEGNR
jgi:hypothetical protein